MDILGDYLLFVVIVDYGKATKAIQLAKEVGATGGTILLGKGTVRSHILSVLGLDESRKEIVLMGIEEELDGYIHGKLEKELRLDKPNHGIAFSMPLKKLIGIDFKDKDRSIGKGDISMKYEAIFTIVNKGMANEVIEAARDAGSTGGTIIHGRGSGTEVTAKLFNLEIEPEKDIILILSKIDNTDNIVKSIKSKIDAEERGRGIIFVLDVSRTTGLYNGE